MQADVRLSCVSMAIVQETEKRDSTARFGGSRHKEAEHKSTTLPESDWPRGCLCSLPRRWSATTVPAHLDLHLTTPEKRLSSSHGGAALLLDLLLRCSPKPPVPFLASFFVFCRHSEPFLLLLLFLHRLQTGQAGCHGPQGGRRGGRISQGGISIGNISDAGAGLSICFSMGDACPSTGVSDLFLPSSAFIYQLQELLKSSDDQFFCTHDPWVCQALSITLEVIPSAVLLLSLNPTNQRDCIAGAALYWSGGLSHPPTTLEAAPVVRPELGLAVEYKQLPFSVRRKRHWVCVFPLPSEVFRVATVTKDPIPTCRASSPMGRPYPMRPHSPLRYTSAGLGHEVGPPRPAGGAVGVWPPLSSPPAFRRFLEHRAQARRPRISGRSPRPSSIRLGKGREAREHFWSISLVEPDTFRQG
ncbi:hypothetical protein EYF80_023906 [Liparis tanakae]|uniref:Uncharacterized protein n=1 Tax=Liparis tanakae TaxID=230148 RepID=A0A4Z2HJG8_9TELE|nr:hypothetical protein EYF80_023906 [Liparis tanakae]